MSKKKKKLFEITIEAYKHFYVQAESEEDALEMEVVDDETSFHFGKADWEHESTRADEVDSGRAKHIDPKRILHNPK